MCSVMCTDITNTRGAQCPAPATHGVTTKAAGTAPRRGRPPRATPEQIVDAAVALVAGGARRAADHGTGRQRGRASRPWRSTATSRTATSSWTRSSAASSWSATRPSPRGAVAGPAARVGARRARLPRTVRAGRAGGVRGWVVALVARRRDAGAHPRAGGLRRRRPRRHAGVDRALGRRLRDGGGVAAEGPEHVGDLRRARAPRARRRRSHGAADPARSSARSTRCTNGSRTGSSRRWRPPLRARPARTRTGTGGAVTTSGKWRWALGFGIAVFVGIVVAASLNQAAFTSQTITGAVIYALTAGSIYAIAASGLVVTYTTSGVFNFAQGAIGMLMAFLYWEVRINHGWPAWIAIVFVVLIAAPLFGAVIERTLMRRLVDAPLVVQLVVTIGLMFFLMGLAVDDLGRELDLAAARVLRRQARHRHRRRRAHLAPVRDHRRGGADRDLPADPALPEPHRRGHARGRRQPRAGGAARHPAGPGVGPGVGARLDDGRDRGDPAGAEHRAAGRRAHALHRRRVRGRDHRPAAQPAVDVRRRADHRRRAELRAQLPAVGWAVEHRVDRDPRGDPVRRAVAAARGAPRGRAAWSRSTRCRGSRASAAPRRGWPRWSSWSRWSPSSGASTRRTCAASRSP